MLEGLKGLSQEQLFASTVSTLAIISGSIIGGICSWIVNKKSICRTEKIQHRIFEDRIKYEEKNKIKNVSENAGLISLDICTAIFQSIRCLKEQSENKEADIYPIPVYTGYSTAVISLKDYLDLKELSYIYQLYGIIDKLNYDIKSYNYLEKNNYNLIMKDCEMVVRKIYGENLNEVLNIDIENVSYEGMYKNNNIKSGYKNILTKLQKISKEENL
jgi:hypothetical protein